MRKILHGIGRFFALLFTILLTLTLISQLTYILCVISIRQAFTPENVYNYMNSINYSTLEIPDGSGGASTIAETWNREMSDIGFEITPSEVNSFVMLFSVDDVVASFAQDFRGWLLDYALEPHLDSKQITEIILSGLDSESYNFMKMFGEPEEMLYTLVDGLTSEVNMHEILEPLLNLRKALSAGTLSLAASGALFVLLIILILERKSILKTGVILGIAGMAASGLTLLSCAAARMSKNTIITSLGLTESLYDIVYEPCDKYLTRYAKLSLMGSAAVFAIFGVGLMIVKIAAAAKNKKEARSETLPPQTIGNAFVADGCRNNTPADGNASEDNTETQNVPGNPIITGVDGEKTEPRETQNETSDAPAPESAPERKDDSEPLL